MPGATPIYGLPFPELDEGANVPADMQALAEATDDALAALAADVAGMATLLWDSVVAGVALPAASITTPALPQTYRDLIVAVVARSDVATHYTLGRFNGDAGPNYDNAISAILGSTVTGTPANGQTHAYVGGCASSALPAGFLVGGILTVLDYARVAKHFCAGYGGNAHGSGGGGQNLLFSAVHKPAVDVAISTLTLYPSGGNFVAGTRISVYGRR